MDAGTIEWCCGSFDPRIFQHRNPCLVGWWLPPLAYCGAQHGDASSGCRHWRAWRSLDRCTCWTVGVCRVEGDLFFRINAIQAIAIITLCCRCDCIMTNASDCLAVRFSSPNKESYYVISIIIEYKQSPLFLVVNMMNRDLLELKFSSYIVLSKKTILKIGSSRNSLHWCIWRTILDYCYYINSYIRKFIHQGSSVLAYHTFLSHSATKNGYNYCLTCVETMNDSGISWRMLGPVPCDMTLETVTLLNPEFPLKKFCGLPGIGQRLRALCPVITIYGDTADRALLLSEIFNTVGTPVTRFLSHK